MPAPSAVSRSPRVRVLGEEVAEMEVADLAVVALECRPGRTFAKRRHRRAEASGAVVTPSIRGVSLRVTAATGSSSLRTRV